MRTYCLAQKHLVREVITLDSRVGFTSISDV